MSEPIPKVIPKGKPIDETKLALAIKINAVDVRNAIETSDPSLKRFIEI